MHGLKPHPERDNRKRTGYTVVLEEFPLIVTDSANVDQMRPAEEITETIN